jgi:predicted phage-related endonuclease
MRWHKQLSKEQWLEARLGYLTSSDAPVIAGVGYTDRFTLWARKTRKVSDISDRLRFRVGLALENLIHEELERETGLTLYDPGGYVLVTRGERGATPDRAILTAEENIDDWVGTAEFKAAAPVHKRAWQGGPSLYATVQMLHTMEVTGLDWGIAAALVGFDDFFYHDIERDELLSEMLLEAEDEFWSLVQRDIPPPLGYEESNKTLKLMFPQAAEEKSLEIDSLKARAAYKGWTTATQALSELNKEVRELEKARQRFENELRLLAEDAERLEIPGAGTITLRTTKAEAYTVEARTYRTMRKERRKKV